MNDTDFETCQKNRAAAIAKRKEGKGNGDGGFKGKGKGDGKGEKGGKKPRGKSQTPKPDGRWCINFSDTGNCKFGNECRYYHPKKAEKEAFTADQRKEKSIK